MTYQSDPVTGVLRRSGFSGIPYSDGDEVETRLLSIVSAARDVSLFSPELRAACTDWASIYHLSATRANLLRPIAYRLKGDVLELGAGCGAITRFLGENGANVVAVEGAARRASIAKARTRDLDNVSIVMDDIGQCSISQQFDVVTLIGVLEYAALFGTSDNPAQALLERCRTWLKPGGILIVAIENQLGLKYFAGAPEDHLTTPNSGIENRYTQRGPRTYGRKALAGLLADAGLPAQRWFAPFPDYKLPIAIISEAGLNDPAFDGGALAAQTASADLQLPEGLAFQTEPVWDVVFQNNLGLELSNSFLLLASAEGPLYLDAESPQIAWHFNTGRAAAYCKATHFESTGAGNIQVRCERLVPKASEPLQALEGPLKFDLVPTTDYVPGRSLIADFHALISQDGWTLEEVATFFCDYLQIIQTLAAERGMPAFPEQLSDTVDGSCFDWLPQNIIRTQTGEFKLIDEEWCYEPPLPLGFLLFRAISVSLVTSTTLGISAQGASFSVLSLIREVLSRIINAPVNAVDIERWLNLEVAVQMQVTGGQFDESDCRFWFNQSPNHFARRLESQNRALKAQIERTEHNLALVIQSRSWAITRPLRDLIEWLRVWRSKLRNILPSGSFTPEVDVNRVDIVLYAHSDAEDMQRCLDALVRTTSPPWRLIIVDDKKKLSTTNLLADFATQRSSCVKHMQTAEATDYSHAANIGLKATAAPRVVLLESNVILTPNWLHRLLACADSDENIGIVGPLDHSSGNAKPDDCSIDQHSLQIAHLAIPSWPRVGSLRGSCLLIKREYLQTFNSIHFDSDFYLYAPVSDWVFAMADDCYLGYKRA